MSFSATWRLPFHEVEPARVEAALKKVLSGHGAKLGPDLDPDLEEFREDFEADATSDLEFSIGISGGAVSEHGDSPKEDPDDDGYYWGLLAVCADGDDEPAFITMDSNTAQNRSCWMALGAIAGELSAALGGPDEPEPM